MDHLLQLDVRVDISHKTRGLPQFARLLKRFYPTFRVAFPLLATLIREGITPAGRISKQAARETAGWAVRLGVGHDY